MRCPAGVRRRRRRHRAPRAAIVSRESQGRGGGEAGKGPTPADTHEGVASAPSGPQTKLIITEFRVFLFSSCHAVIDRQKYSKLGIISIFECVYLSNFEKSFIENISESLFVTINKQQNKNQKNLLTRFDITEILSRFRIIVEIIISLSTS